MNKLDLIVIYSALGMLLKHTNVVASFIMFMLVCLLLVEYFMGKYTGK